MSILSAAERAVKKIENDLRDRSGLQNEWENIDDETQNEIKSKWVKIIAREVLKEIQP